MIMKNKWMKFIAGLSLVFCLTLVSVEAPAQCPMCKMSAESNLKNGGTQGRGLNNGILYMLATPYLVVGLIGYMWWRNRKREEDEAVEDLIEEVNR